jgi:zinc resistance-associated protein
MKEEIMYKRIIMILAVMVSAGFIAGSAWACPWDGNWGGYGWGSGSGYYDNYGVNNQDFMNDTASIREELAAKHGEYNALMSQQNPDPKQAGQLQADIAKLNNQIQQKAQKYNMPSWGEYNSGSPNNHRYCGYRGCW